MLPAKQLTSVINFNVIFTLRQLMSTEAVSRN